MKLTVCNLGVCFGWTRVVRPLDASTRYNIIQFRFGVVMLPRRTGAVLVVPRTKVLLIYLVQRVKRVVGVFPDGAQYGVHTGGEDLFVNVPIINSAQQTDWTRWSQMPIFPASRTSNLILRAFKALFEVLDESLADVVDILEQICKTNLESEQAPTSLVRQCIVTDATRDITNLVHSRVLTVSPAHRSRSRLTLMAVSTPESICGKRLQMSTIITVSSVHVSTSVSLSH